MPTIQSGNAVIALPTSYITQHALAVGEVGDPPVAVTVTNPLPVADRPFSGTVAMTAGAIDGLPRRAIRISCTAAGNVALKLADDSVELIPIEVGLSILPYAVKSVATAGTTATATYANLV